MSPQVFFDALMLGFEYSLLAVGVFITFRILDMADLTVDGSFGLGMACSAVCAVAGHPYLGLVVGAVAGAAAGCVTGLLVTRARINPLLAGIITMTGLYSVNIYVLGAPNVSLLNAVRVFDPIQTALGGAVPVDAVKMGFVVIVVAVVVAALSGFFKTETGLAMRAVGDNEAMSRASSINTDAFKVGGLALGNALVGLTGAILAQYQGFADLSSGTGMVMVGLASVIIGEVFGGHRSVTWGLACAVAGSVAYRVIIQLALAVNLLDANALKLVSAVIVAAFMALPAVQAAMGEGKTRRRARTAMDRLLAEDAEAFAGAGAVAVTATGAAGAGAGVGADGTADDDEGQE